MTKEMELKLRKDFADKMYSKLLNTFAEEINSATKFLISKHPEGVVKSSNDEMCFELNNLSKEETKICSKIEKLLNIDIAFHLELKASQDLIKIINEWFREDLLKKLEEHGMKNYWFSWGWDSESYDIDFESWDPSHVQIMYHN